MLGLCGYSGLSCIRIAIYEFLVTIQNTVYCSCTDYDSFNEV